MVWRTSRDPSTHVAKKLQRIGQHSFQRQHRLVEGVPQLSGAPVKGTRTCAPLRPWSWRACGRRPTAVRAFATSTGYSDLEGQVNSARRRSVALKSEHSAAKFAHGAAELVDGLDSNRAPSGLWVRSYPTAPIAPGRNTARWLAQASPPRRQRVRYGTYTGSS